ncbi:hypothetical protein [Leptospira meyeri]|uniref:hypothetical protein n=1 Tax=Leptospira meyeri TaxID=29508 RepID=UPI00056084CC|nr:hypothetical protein [Leptospira meyeri]
MKELNQVFAIKLMLSLIAVLASVGCKSQEETGSGSKACSESWKLYQTCLIINDHNARFCDSQRDGIVMSCGMM